MKTILYFLIGILLATFIVATLDAPKSLAEQMTFQELSICFSNNTDEIVEQMTFCTEEDYQCMVDAILNVCN